MATLHTQFQASKPSGSKVEDFSNICLCVSMGQTKDPCLEAILDPGTFYLNILGRGGLCNVTYQISNIWAKWF